MNHNKNVLGICGSLRQASVNRLFLESMQLLCPSHIHFEIYSKLSHIPIFNPDFEETDDLNVTHWREAIAQADLILLVTPEYTHGVTGVIKNALDWIVGSGEFTDKPIAFPNLAIRTNLAYLQLVDTLNVMGANIIEECSPQASPTEPYIRIDITKEQLIQDQDIYNRFMTLWQNIDQHLQNRY